MRLVPLVFVMMIIVSACSPVAGDARGGSPVPTVPPFTLQPSGVILGSGAPASLPAVGAEQERRVASIQVAPWVVLRPGLDGTRDAAQRAAATAPSVQLHTRTSSGDRLLTEVMAVAPAVAGDIPSTIRCVPGRCMRVVLYVYPTNTTVTAILDDRLEVRDVQALADAQPEIPRELADLATQIAIADPQVAAAFDGLSPEAAMAAMSATKTALEGTACERSRHLCVAPVFVWGDTALWTIVDLTTFTLVAATTWTELGSSGRRVWSEATAQDTALGHLCDEAQTIERDGWRATYLLTSSDGLELRDVTYQGRPVIQSAKVVDWHVGYAGSNDQRVGFSDAVGCPVFSAAAVIPYGPPVITDMADGGFQLRITFRSPNWPQPCNYQYTFTATFGADGEAAILAGNEGRGCGIGATYHPILRIAPPTGSLRLVTPTTDRVISSEGWEEWASEAPNRLRVANADGVIELAPVWGDAELAYVYWTHAKPDEGQGDLPSIGNCCALDANQGPEQFIGPGAPEALADQSVIWFVPRITNAERERCWADTTLIDGMLRPDVWPCAAGVRVRVGP